MFDWLTSKTAVAVAAVVILGVMVGFFLVKLADLEEQSLDAEADALAGYLNDITSKDADFKVRFTFSSGSQGYDLPPTINGKSYEIRISNYQVALTQKDRTAFADLIEPVHGFYPPQCGTIEPDNLFTADLLVENFTVPSGSDFYVESRPYLMPGKEYLVFCYEEDGMEEAVKLKETADLINDFGAFDMSDPGQWDDIDTTTLETDVTLAGGVVTTGRGIVAFTQVMHLWEPGNGTNVTKAQLDSTDLEHRTLDIPAGNRLVLQRKHLVFTDTAIPGGENAESVEIFAYDGGAA